MFLKLVKVAQAGLLIAGYPLIVYFLITHGASWIGAAVVVGLVLWKIRHREDWFWWLAGLILLTLLTIRLSGIDAIPKMAPLLIHTGLFYLFFQSLKNRPLIEQFARLDFPEMPPEIEVYCRQLTVLWSGFFALNILGCLWLAFWGNNAWWVLYNGLIVYFLIAALMTGEYIWRRHRFPDLEIPSFTHTMNNIMKNGHKIWGQKTHDSR